MYNTFRIRFGFSLSDNLKSKIENLKCLGFSVLRFRARRGCGSG